MMATSSGITVRSLTLASFLALAAARSASGQGNDFPPLPSGPGLAAAYPADRDIATDPAVLFAEDFETGSLDDLLARWTDGSRPPASILEFADDSPSSGGSRSLQMTATVPRNTGGFLYKRLDPGLDRAFARFYVKFPDPPGYIHHFVHFGGYNPPTDWAQGGAGERPAGDDRITVGIEPFGRSGSVPPPGDWNFYAYWHEMKGSADNRYWGNGLTPAVRQPVPADRWQCVEVMIQLNDVGDKNGRLALWLDGALVADIHRGTPIGRWTGLGFAVTERGGEPFEGFDFRTSDELDINFFWLLHYVTETNQRRNRVADIAAPNRVWFDQIVVARQYIGPLGGTTEQK